MNSLIPVTEYLLEDTDEIIRRVEPKLTTYTVQLKENWWAETATDFEID